MSSQIPSIEEEDYSSNSYPPTHEELQVQYGGIGNKNPKKS